MALKTLFEKQQEQQKQIKKLKWVPTHLLSSGNIGKDPQYKEILEWVICSLEELLQWSINLESLENPVVLPSGHTVHQKTMEQFIEGAKCDPFDPSKQWDQLIHNRIAKEFQKILDIIKVKVAEIQVKNIPVEKDTQDISDGIGKLSIEQKPINRLEFEDEDI